MHYHEILAGITALEKDESLYKEKNFNGRVQAIDDIEFHLIGRIDSLLAEEPELLGLKQRAESLKAELEDIDLEMFCRLRLKISEEGYRGELLMDLLEEYIALSTPSDNEHEGYDNTDLFFNGLLAHQNLPAETREREPEMVFYQKTPAAITLKLIRKAGFKPDDVFFDIGAGLGQVNILVSLFTGVTSIGVEFEPAFCNYAHACATALKLTNIPFINQDARHADYSRGTVFFMYTPFEGKMLQEVLQKLKSEGADRKIRIFTYGPCTPAVAQQDWLMSNHETQNPSGGFGEFISR